MATLGCFSKPIWDTSDLYFEVLSDRLPNFTVNSFTDGIAEIRFGAGISIEDAFDVAMGCFETCSNFRQELLKVYDCSANTTLEGIRFHVLDGTIFVSPTTTAEDRNKLVKEYYANMPIRPSVSDLCW